MRSLRRSIRLRHQLAYPVALRSLPHLVHGPLMGQLTCGSQVNVQLLYDVIGKRIVRVWFIIARSIVWRITRLRMLRSGNHVPGQTSLPRDQPQVALFDKVQQRQTTIAKRRAIFTTRRKLLSIIRRRERHLHAVRDAQNKLLLRPNRYTGFLFY